MFLTVILYLVNRKQSHYSVSLLTGDIQLICLLLNNSRASEALNSDRQAEHHNSKNRAIFNLSIEIETDAILTLWSTGLAAWIASGCAQRRRRTTWRPYSSYYQIMHSWFPPYIFDIEHPLYDQLTPVKTRYLMFRAYQDHKFFLN